MLGPHSSSTAVMPNLDFVRSIAVLLVFVEHVLLALRIYELGPFPVAWIGVSGVFMFFILTSLVLMWSLDRAPGFLNFYVRRIFRIYPLAITAILVIVFFHTPTMQSPNGDTYFIMPSLRSIAENLLLIQDLHGKSILGVMWSLPLEVHMYLFLPFFYFFLRRKFFAWPIVLLWLCFVILGHIFYKAFYGTFLGCVTCFLPGITAYVLYAKIRPRLPFFVLPILLLADVLLFLLRPSFQTGSFFALVIGLALPWFMQIRQPLSKRVFHVIAKYSYGIYLAHPFCIALGINFLSSYPLFVRLAVTVGSLAIVVPLAYHLLEKPMMNLGAKLAARIEAHSKQLSLAVELRLPNS